MTVPGYVDNNLISRSNTTQIRGNTVSDLSGGTVVAFSFNTADNILVKNNKALRIRSSTGDAYGFKVEAALWGIFLYNVASRTNMGFYFDGLTTLDVYNATCHNCNWGIYSASVCTSVIRNLAISSYPDTALYKNSYGIYADTGVTLDVDYVMHYGLADLVEAGPGTVTQGAEISEHQILYQNEPSDDLTPDPISELTHEGTTNPFLLTYYSIGGIESPVRGEISTGHMYHYELMDSTFWDIDRDDRAEVAFVKDYQSRIAGNTELALTTAIRDYYLKIMESTQGFSELFPTAAYYADAYTFSRRVMDLWYATQNPGTTQAYQNGIGGYNLLPSFYMRQFDDPTYWVVAKHIVGVNNILAGSEGIKYGISIDVLGISTISSSAWDECQSNVLNCIADIAPIRWRLHDEVEPTGYVVCTELYNDFDLCTLTYAVYSDNYTIISSGALDRAGNIQDMTVQTAKIPTAAFYTRAPVYAEFSLLDRVYSESLVRDVYYRQGDDDTELNGASWIPLPVHIGSYFIVQKDYVQFKIEVSGILRQFDYEFIGLALRPWYTSHVLGPDEDVAPGDGGGWEIWSVYGGLDGFTDLTPPPT